MRPKDVAARRSRMDGCRAVEVFRSSRSSPSVTGRDYSFAEFAQSCRCEIRRLRRTTAAGRGPWPPDAIEQIAPHRPGRVDGTARRRHCSNTRTSPVECTTLPPTMVSTERRRLIDSSGTVK